MIKKAIKYLTVFLFIALTSCKTAPENIATYFGGKIINPKSKYVLLYSMDKIIDTLSLDKNNKFLGTLKNIHEGLYYFQHGPENQYIYLEPKDSLMLRLNTWDFDESLVFTGKGAERNNILIDCFLEGEKEENKFYTYNTLSPSNFTKKVDSIIKTKLTTYNNYIINHPEETKGFKNILKTALTFPTYSRIESYPIAHAIKMNLDSLPKMSHSFYNFRKNIFTNNDSLMYYYPYSKYIRSYLYNITYSLGHKPMVNEFSSDFTVDLLHSIHNKINSDKIKNTFLKQTTITHFYKKSSANIHKNTFDTFLKLSSNEEDIQTVLSLVNDSKVLQKGKQINNFSIINRNRQKIPIKKLLNKKNTFLYFWNPTYVSKSYISSRIAYLSTKFPSIQFIQIKIDGTFKDKIPKLNNNNQYFIDNTSKANLFLTSKMPRSILIDKKGIIQNGYASLSSMKIIHQLKDLSEN